MPWGGCQTLTGCNAKPSEQPELVAVLSWRIAWREKALLKAFLFDAMQRNPIGTHRQQTQKNPEKTAFSQGNSPVRLLGLEPKTYGLKVRCSTD